MIIFWRAVFRLLYRFSWLGVLVIFCKPSERTASALESVNITRLLTGDQFPNPECPLKPVQFIKCGGIIRRGCFSRSLPSNYCTKSKATCADLEKCCWCKCPLASPTFFSQTQGDNSKRCVSDRDLPKFIVHFRRPACRYRMVAKLRLSSCHNVTVPVLDLTKTGNAKIAVCRDAIHKVRAPDQHHDVNKCDLNPKEVKYLVNGVWHDLSRVHLNKLEIRRVHSRSVKPRPYFILKWTAALGIEFAGLLFSMKTNCRVMEPSRVTRSTDVCLQFKSAGTFKPNQRLSETPTSVHSSAIPEQGNFERKVSNETSKTSATSSWKPTAIPITHSKDTKPTDDRSLESNNQEDPNISMVVALSCSLAIVCVVLIIGAIIFLRRYKRKRKGQESKGNTLYKLPRQTPEELGTENIYEALQAPHIYQSLTAAKSLEGREYIEPTEQQKNKNDTLSKNHLETSAFTKKGSFSDREVGGYIEPDHGGYPVADFQKDAPVPVNSKRLPGYYEPACIILGSSHRTPDPEGFGNSTGDENYLDDKTPKYFVLEKQSEE